MTLVMLFLAVLTLVIGLFGLASGGPDDHGGSKR